ncbi:MAG: aminotransferase class V-fold PLP-dependent enzyme, partial [Pseudolabrys sp.]|nr:aminotransferase class V-fold PLP-dependent enzyme [Pseudolabrys sp.]
MTTSTRAYFDWNATAPLRPEARSAVLRALEGTGNASSVHGEGRTARALIERARIAVAELVGAEAKNVTFTSGGSEANALALNGAPGRVLVSAIEHPSVLTAREDRIPVTARGVIDLDALRAQLAGKPALVSIMLVNNETGIIQPIRAAADIVHAAGGLLHVDAVQAAGRIAIDLDELGADLLTISSHKI